jgi:hypothetical protein
LSYKLAKIDRFHIVKGVAGSEFEINQNMLWLKYNPTMRVEHVYPDENMDNGSGKIISW